MTTHPRLFLSPPHMGGDEQKFIQDAFISNYIAPLGPMVDGFERDFAAYTGIPHCLALSSGTAAMHLALRELGVGPDDLVLASTLTFIGSVNSAAYLGATVAFIDADSETWNMAPDLLAKELDACARHGKLPKVVIPTDLYGQCADLPRIQAVCERYEIPVVVDSAESVGAWYLAGVGGRESGVRGQVSGVRSQESVIRRCESGVRSQGSGIGNWELLIRSPGSEVGLVAPSRADCPP